MSDAYKIAVTMSLTDKVSGGLHAMAASFEKVDKLAEGMQKRLDSMKESAKAGGGLIDAGRSLIGIFKVPFDEAGKLDAEVKKFSALNLDGDIASQAEKFSQGMDVMGQSLTDNKKLMREVMAATHDLSQTEQVVPVLAKMKFGLESVMGDGSSEQFGEMVATALKTAELRGTLKDGVAGKIDLSRFSNVLDMMVQSFVGSNGKVTPQDYAEAMKSGSLSTGSMNDEMFFFGLGHFMEKSGGAATGAASLALFNELALGKMSPEVAGKLDKLHLLNQKAIHTDTRGKITKVDPMGVKDAGAFAENPFKWINEVVVPELKKQGLEGNALNRELASLLGANASADMAVQLAQDQKQAEDYIARSKKAVGVAGLYDLGAGSMHGQQMELQKQWNELMLELGEQILPLAIEALKTLNPLIRDLTRWMHDHASAAKELAFGLLALGGALIGFGTLGIIAAGFNSIAAAFSTLSGAGGAVGLAKVGADLAAIGNGATAIAGVAEIATLGVALGAISGGLGLLAGAATGMGWLLTEIDPDTDEFNHPGERRKHLRGHADLWEKDATLPQEHAGMHFVRYGRGGTWVKDEPRHPTVMPPPPAKGEHVGEHFIGRGPTGHWEKNTAPPAEAPATPPVVNVSVYMDSKELTSHMVASTSQGPSGMNGAASLLRPGISSLGLA
jgi:hypothetical protein